MRYTIQKRGRFWSVMDQEIYDPGKATKRDEFGGLVAVVVYKKGAEEVARRLNKQVNS